MKKKTKSLKTLKSDLLKLLEQKMNPSLHKRFEPEVYLIDRLKTLKRVRAKARGLELAVINRVKKEAGKKTAFFIENAACYDDEVNACYDLLYELEKKFILDALSFFEHVTLDEIERELE